MKRVLKWVGIAFLYLCLLSVSAIVWEVFIKVGNRGAFIGFVMNIAMVVHMVYHRRKKKK